MVIWIGLGYIHIYIRTDWLIGGGKARRELTNACGGAANNIYDGWTISTTTIIVEIEEEVVAKVTRSMTHAYINLFGSFLLASGVSGAGTGNKTGGSGDTSCCCWMG